MLMNDWMGRFYDVGGVASEVSSGDTDALQQGQVRVLHLLLEFALLCTPSVFVHPIFKLATNRWVMSWRLALIDSYVERWDPATMVVENAAQRVHEDTARFARGLHTCVVVLLDSVLTIAVFAPILVDLGARVKPVDLPDSWMLITCIIVASTGVIFSVVFGWSLIDLEINNQRVEADVRKMLVLREETPAIADAPPIDRTPVFMDVSNASKDFLEEFRKVVASMRFNYIKLYYRFAFFSVWLGSYEQTVVLLPYVLTGPLLYSTGDRITLGMVTKTSHSFSNLFDAMNVLSDRWLDVTDFISVMRRLNEFESRITQPSSVRSALIAAVEMIPPMHESEATS